MNDKEKKAIQKKIAKYRDYLNKEKAIYGGYDDSKGLRYQIPPLYMKIMDLAGGNRYYNWFWKNFEDDSGEAILFLTWTALFFHRGEEKKAYTNLKKMVHKNIYLIPLILGIKFKKEKIWHSSYEEEPDYCSFINFNELGYLTDEFKDWLESAYKSDEIKNLIKVYIECRKALLTEKNIQKRKKILEKEIAAFSD